MNFIYMKFGYRFLSRAALTAAHASLHSPPRIQSLLLCSSGPARAGRNESGRSRPRTRSASNLRVCSRTCEGPRGFPADSRLVSSMRNNSREVRGSGGASIALVVAEPQRTPRTDLKSIDWNRRQIDRASAQATRRTKARGSRPPASRPEMGDPCQPLQVQAGSGSE